MLSTNVLCMKKKKKRSYYVSNVSDYGGKYRINKNKRNTVGVGMMQITEDTPPDMLAGAMDLMVHLPDGKSTKMSVERSTPMMDVLVQITNANHLQISGFVLQPLAMNTTPGYGEKVLPYFPNTPIGTLDTQDIRVVAKNRGATTLQRNNPQQPFESTFRLKVHLPRNQLYVERVSMNAYLRDIMKKMCDEKNLDASKYEFRHPGNLDQVLDLKFRLTDYQITEVYAVNKGSNRLLTQVFSSSESIMAFRKDDDRKQKSNSGGGLFNFLKRGGKVSNGSGSLSSDNRSISPTHSDDSRSVSPPVSSQPPVKMVADKEKPKPPVRKRRPAPKPPSQNTNENEPKHNENETTTTTTTSMRKKEGLTICHSRNSSDSSGYHEASILSDNAANTSLPRKRPQTIIDSAHSKSTSNLTAMKVQSKSTSSLAFTSRNKKKAPPPPPGLKSASSIANLENASPVVASPIDDDLKREDFPNTISNIKSKLTASAAFTPEHKDNPQEDLQNRSETFSSIKRKFSGKRHMNKFHDSMTKKWSKKFDSLEKEPAPSNSYKDYKENELDNVIVPIMNKAVTRQESFDSIDDDAIQVEVIESPIKEFPETVFIDEKSALKGKRDSFWKSKSMDFQMSKVLFSDKDKKSQKDEDIEGGNKSSTILQKMRKYTSSTSSIGTKEESSVKNTSDDSGAVEIAKSESFMGRFKSFKRNKTNSTEEVVSEQTEQTEGVTKSKFSSLFKKSASTEEVQRSATDDQNPDQSIFPRFFKMSTNNTEDDVSDDLEKAELTEDNYGSKMKRQFSKMFNRNQPSAESTSSIDVSPGSIDVEAKLEEVSEKKGLSKFFKPKKVEFSKSISGESDIDIEEVDEEDYSTENVINEKDSQGTKTFKIKKQFSKIFKKSIEEPKDLPNEGTVSCEDPDDLGDSTNKKPQGETSKSFGRMFKMPSTDFSIKRKNEVKDAIEGTDEQKDIDKQPNIKRQFSSYFKKSDSCKHDQTDQPISEKNAENPNERKSFGKLFKMTSTDFLNKKNNDEPPPDYEVATNGADDVIDKPFGVRRQFTNLFKRSVDSTVEPSFEDVDKSNNSEDKKHVATPGRMFKMPSTDFLRKKPKETEACIDDVEVESVEKVQPESIHVKKQKSQKGSKTQKENVEEAEAPEQKKSFGKLFKMSSKDGPKNPQATDEVAERNEQQKMNLRNIKLPTSSSHLDTTMYDQNESVLKKMIKSGSLRRRSSAKGQKTKNKSKAPEPVRDTLPEAGPSKSMTISDSEMPTKKRRKVVKQSSLRLATRNRPLKSPTNKADGEISKIKAVLVRRLSSSRKSSACSNDKSAVDDPVRPKPKQRLNKVTPQPVHSNVDKRNARMFAPEEDFNLDEEEINEMSTAAFLERVQPPNVKLKQQTRKQSKSRNIPREEKSPKRKDSNNKKHNEDVYATNSPPESIASSLATTLSSNIETDIGNNIKEEITEEDIADALKEFNHPAPYEENVNAIDTEITTEVIVERIESPTQMEIVKQPEAPAPMKVVPKSTTEVIAEKPEPIVIEHPVVAPVVEKVPDVQKEVPIIKAPLVQKQVMPQVDNTEWEYQLPSPPTAFRDSSPQPLSTTDSETISDINPSSDSILTSPELFEKLNVIKESQLEIQSTKSVDSEEDKFISKLSLENLEKRKKLVYNRELATSLKYDENDADDSVSSKRSSVLSELEDVLAKPAPPTESNKNWNKVKAQVENFSARNDRALPNFKITTYDIPKKKINIFEDDSIRSNVTAPTGEEEKVEMRKPRQEFNKHRCMTLNREFLQRSESFNTWTPTLPVKRSKSQVAIKPEVQKREEPIGAAVGEDNRSRSTLDLTGLQSIEVMKAIRTTLTTTAPTTITTSTFKHSMHSTLPETDEVDASPVVVAKEPPAVKPPAPPKEEPRRPVSFYGTPTINLTSWKERKPTFGPAKPIPFSSTTPINGTPINHTVATHKITNNTNANNVSIKVNGSEAISQQSGGNVLIKIQSQTKPQDELTKRFINHTTAVGYRRPLGNINKVETGSVRPHSIAFDQYDASRVPIVRSVELKKPFKDMPQQNGTNTSVTQIRPENDYSIGKVNVNVNGNGKINMFQNVVLRSAANNRRNERNEKAHSVNLVSNSINMSSGQAGDQRGQLLDAIRNFGGKKGLKTVKA